MKLHRDAHEQQDARYRLDSGSENISIVQTVAGLIEQRTWCSLSHGCTASVLQSVLSIVKQP